MADVSSETRNELTDVAELLKHFHELVRKGEEIRRATRDRLERARAVVQQARRLHREETDLPIPRPR